MRPFLFFPLLLGKQARVLDPHFRQTKTAAGAETATAADVFAAKLQRQIELDNQATVLAGQVREPQGSLLSDRLIFALSRHLMPVLTRVSGLGTGIQLSISMERRRDAKYPDGLTFSAIARRPFTPKEEK